MREARDVFHCAIPSHDLSLAYEFYVVKLGCKLARRYPDRITLDFFGDQLVCHYNPEYILPEPSFYPRHFGITFKARADFDRLLHLLEVRVVPFFTPPSTRFAGSAEEHVTFGLLDPSHNVLEFKYYTDPRMMY
jgi:uncharacterized protein